MSLKMSSRSSRKNQMSNKRKRVKMRIMTLK